MGYSFKLYDFHRMNSKPKERRAKQKPTDITGGYTEDGIPIGLLKSPPDFFIDKPNEPGYTSGIRDSGMGFIYSSATRNVVPYWYGCTVNGCRRVFNLYLPDGNGKLKRHVDRHQASASYTLHKNDLVNLLSVATKIGMDCGFMPVEALNKIVPSSSALNSSGFLVNFEDLMRKCYAQLESSVNETEKTIITATGLYNSFPFHCFLIVHGLKILLYKYFQKI